MSKANFDLLQVMIRKTLDDTHKKDVLDYFKKGKISEKERDELLEYLKLINGIVLARIGVHKNKVEFTGDPITSGWKIHLAVNPENYQYVFRWLFLNGPYDYKHLHGGEADSGKDFTIYIGSWDDLFSFAGIIETELGDRLKDFDQKLNTDDLRVYQHVGARFQLSDKLQSDYDYRKKFDKYGFSGPSFLYCDIMTLLEQHGFEKNNILAFSQHLWGLYKEVLAIRGYKELGKMFGDYFLGAKRPNFLTRFFNDLEKKHGSELPKPGKSDADIAYLTEKCFPYSDYPDVGNALIENKIFLRTNIFAPDGKSRRDSLWYSAWEQFLKVLPVLMGTKLASLLRNKDGAKVILNQVKDVVSSTDIGLIAFVPSLLAWYLVEFNFNRKPSASRTRKIKEIYDQRYSQTKKQPSFEEVCEMARTAA